MAPEWEDLKKEKSDTKLGHGVIEVAQERVETAQKRAFAAPA